jgi:hypothetical protein
LNKQADLPDPRRGGGVACVLLATGLLLSGCSTDKLHTSFTTTNSGFEFKGVANAEHPLDDPTAETWRHGLLESYLLENHLCPNGYAITERSPVLVEHTASGDHYDVIYEGHCQ